MYDGAGLLAQSDGAIQIGGPNGQLNQHGWVDDLVLVFEDSDGAGPQNTLLSSRLLHGPDIDQVFAQESATGDILWALTDQQGTIKDWVQATEQNGDATTQTEIVNHLNIDALGNILNITNGNGDTVSLDDRLTVLPAYTGQIYDIDSGLHYFRARWYDSSIGQFTNEDPLGFAVGDANVRRFVGNEVTTNVDPTGLDDERGKKPKILWIYNDADRLAKPFGYAGTNYATAVIGTSDPTHLKPVINNWTNAYGPIDILVIVDHADVDKDGSNDRPTFGGSVMNPEWFAKIRPALATDGILVLGHCEVGQNKPLCREIAEHSGHTVIASTEEVTFIYRPALANIFKPHTFYSNGDWVVFPGPNDNDPPTPGDLNLLTDPSKRAINEKTR